MQYPEHLKEDIRSRVDIADLIARYLPLKKAGSRFKALCPFHNEKTPSFTVTPSKGIFHCFGCGKGGDVFTFLMEMEKVGFSEAFKLLAKEAGIDLSKYATSKQENKDEYDAIYRANELALRFFHRSLKENKDAYSYFTERKVTPETIDAFKLGYAPAGWDNLIQEAKKENISVKDLEMAGLLVLASESGKPYDRFRERIMFPVYNISGLPIAFGGRVFKAEEKGAKYINSPETAVYRKSVTLYGLHASRAFIRESNAAVLVEGYMDYHSLFQNGIQNVVASSGTALTLDQARMIRRFAEKIFILFDGDTAGVKASERGIDILLNAGLETRMVTLPANVDPDNFIKKNGADALRQLLEKAEGYVDFKLRAAIGRHGDKTPEAKSRVVKEIAESLAAIEDEITKKEYIRGISGKLRMDQDLVQRAVHHSKKQPSRSLFAKEKPSAAVTESGGYKIEEELLRFLMIWPALADKTEVLRNGDIWGHEAIKAFFDRLVTFIHRKGGVNADFAAGLTDFSPKEQKFIAQTLSTKDEKIGSKEWDLGMIEREWEININMLLIKFCNKRLRKIKDQMKEPQADLTFLQKEAKRVGDERKELEKQNALKRIEK